jgi:hypothetical protein
MVEWTSTKNCKTQKGQHHGKVSQQLIVEPESLTRCTDREGIDSAPT